MVYERGQEKDGDAREVTSTRRCIWPHWTRRRLLIWPSQGLSQIWVDAKTAFDVAKPDMIAGLLKEKMGGAWMDACGAVEMRGLNGKASFEFCETEFRYLRCIRQGSVEAPT